jgi:hypothetical protein
MLGLYRCTLASQPLGATVAAAVAARRGFTKTRFQLKTVASEKFPAPKSPTTTTTTHAAVPPGDATAAATVTSINSGGGGGGGGIMSFPKENPFAFQMIVATAKTMAADLMVQTVAEGKSLEEVDWKRNGIFVVFGFAYLGGFQWWLMVNKYRQWFPTMDKFAKMSFADKLKYPAGILDAAKMVVFDITIHLPLMYFPTYYAVKEFVGGDSWNPVDWVVDGVTKYRGNMEDDLTAMVKLWAPSDCVQFVLPLHIRMPFRHMVSFFWTAYVSFTRGAITKNTQPSTIE